MTAAPLHPREAERLAALRSLGLSEAPHGAAGAASSDHAFDALTRLARALLDVPIAVVSLVDETRQWFPSGAGLDATGTPREVAFCAHTLLEDAALVVPDTTRDPRFAANPLVTGPPHIAAYAGVPLRTPDGLPIGTVCVMDVRPRPFPAEAMALLQDVAGIARRDVAQRLAAAEACRVARELEATREALEAVNRQQTLMLDNELVGIVRVRDRRILWANRAFCQLLGHAAGDLEGRPTRDLYPSDKVYRTLGTTAHAATTRGEKFRAHAPMVRRDGTPLWVDISGAPLPGQDDDSLWMVLDVTAMKHHQMRVEVLAYQDPLTGLPNRTLLHDRLSQALAAALRHPQQIAVCFGDLDRFKAVNDLHGHDAGDLLLQEVARRLKARVRAVDTVSRLGGDEFVLLLIGLADRAEGEAIVQRAADAVAAPFALPGGAEVAVGASFGVAWAEPGDTDAAALLSRADAAMYLAKRSRRGDAPTTT